MPEPRSKPVRWVLAALALVCAFSLLVRWIGADFLLPHHQPLDGTVIERQVGMYRYPQPGQEQEELYHYYPHLAARITALLPESWVREPTDASLESQLALARANWLEFRRTSAVLSTLLLLATWILARRFVGETWALFAAALVGTSLLYCFYTAEMRPHGIAATANTWAVLACMRLLRRGSSASYLLAGLACGLALGALQYGLFTLPCLLIAHLLARRDEPRPWWNLALAALPIAVCVRLFYPFYFLGKNYFQLSGWQLNLSGQPLKLNRFDGSGFVSIVETLWSYDPLLLFLGVGGALALALRALRGRSLGPERAALLVGFAFLLPYVLVIGMYAETWERFVLNLLPWLALAAAALLARWKKPLLAGLLLVPMAALDVQLARVRCAPDTAELAARWIEQNAEPEKTFIQALPYVDLPLFHTQSVCDESKDNPWNSRWFYFEVQFAPPERGPRYALHQPPPRSDPIRPIMVSDPMAWVAARHPDLVLLSVDPGTAWLVNLREGLLRSGPQLARFTPRSVDDGSATFFAGRHLNGFHEPFWVYLTRVARMGPTLEIYRPPTR